MREAIHTISPYMMTIQQVIIAVANRFQLPIENGYTVTLCPATEWSAGVTVTVPEWGKKSYLTFTLDKWRDDLWEPEGEGRLFMGHDMNLPRLMKGQCLAIRFERKQVKSGRRWPMGPYPRYRIHARVVSKGSTADSSIFG
jgi:hypothetical protein